ncbi:hypothetical protein M8494_27390 [Serratia ureilytica]
MLAAVNITRLGTVTRILSSQAGKCTAQAGDIVVQVTVRGRFAMIVPDGGKNKVPANQDAVIFLPTARADD